VTVPGTPGGTPPYGGDSGGSPRKVTVTRVAAARTRQLLGGGAHRIRTASRAGGAQESGLTALIWTHTVNYAADAMIAVSLAGTIFFSAARSQQRGNVALYLLVTMAPFAVVAPLVGPALDRLHRGRRLALAGTSLLRAMLAWIMAANFGNPVALYLGAFGILVLSKAYAVLRGACVPRVLPERMSLVAANARLSIFGLVAAAVAAALLAGFIQLTGSYPWALRITVGVFLAAAVLALRLPARVDSAEGEQSAAVLSRGWRGRLWAGEPLGQHVVTALRAAGALRALAGFLTLFLAFLIQDTARGFGAAAAVAGLAVAAGGGSLVGTVLGIRLRLARPDPVLLTSIGAVAVTCVVAALSYSLSSAILVALLAGIANSLGKLCLDAIVQREVPDRLRASAFARAETLLQLAWVFGGGLGIALPSEGRLGFWVATALVVLAFAATIRPRRSRSYRR
jgi:hypothetical protein